jgi:hypothetical protein
MNWKGFERKRYYPSICVGSLRDYHEKNSASIECTPAEIRTESFPNISLERYLPRDMECMVLNYRLKDSVVGPKPNALGSCSGGARFHSKPAHD